MLPQLHQVLQDMIFREGKIDRSEVDIAFEVPSKDWMDRLVRPTVCLYLFELVENMDLRQAQFQQRRDNGHTIFHSPPRRIDLRYIVTALTTNPDDAFRLLWHTLVVLERAPVLTPDLFPHELVLEAPVVTRVAEPDNGIKLLDVWSAVGTEPRPAFSFVVTLPLDLALEFKEPFVMTRGFGYRKLTDKERLESRMYITGVVRDKSGAALSNVTVALVDEPNASVRTAKDGGFTLRTPEEGKVPLRLSRPGRKPKTMVIDVPAAAYDLLLD